ncbi:MAG: hypothetical protein Q8K96_15110 [Rubrivivax sp.]|nr:hypothetical protein [Rubrivivax sp.]
MTPSASTLAGCALALTLAGCATRAVDVAPLPANPAEFSAWTCEHVDDETDSVQQRAADVAWTVDERAGNNILALGVGLTVFWPAILAMRSDGPEAAELARLKGRYDALRAAAGMKNCPPPSADLPPARAAALPVAVGEQLVYEDRTALKGPATEWILRLTALRRGEIEYLAQTAPRGTWRQDRSGNILSAPEGALQWPHLLRADLALGAVTGGDMVIVGDPLARARMRGQVVAVGPQTVAGRRFDVAVVELFGDAQSGEGYTRVDGAIVIDRRSGVLLRLDLRSAHGDFTLQRRLVRVDPAPG